MELRQFITDKIQALTGKIEQKQQEIDRKAGPLLREKKTLESEVQALNKLLKEFDKETAPPKENKPKK